MPIYEYECRACGHDFETIQKISEPVLVDCPACAKPSLKKLISRVSFRLKGTGWYETDFKNKKKTEPTSKQPDKNGNKTDDDSKQEDAKSSKSSSSNAGESTSNKTTESNERSVSSET